MSWLHVSRSNAQHAGMSKGKLRSFQDEERSGHQIKCALQINHLRGSNVDDDSALQDELQGDRFDAPISPIPSMDFSSLKRPQVACPNPGRAMGKNRKKRRTIHVRENFSQSFSD
jgi:hypothetical protein